MFAFALGRLNVKNLEKNYEDLAVAGKKRLEKKDAAAISKE